MRSFKDENGRVWIATALEEETPRHHGRWYLVFHPEGQPDAVRPVPEVRWKTRASAERTVRTMSETELRRRLRAARERSPSVEGSRDDG